MIVRSAKDLAAIISNPSSCAEHFTKCRPKLNFFFESEWCLMLAPQFLDPYTMDKVCYNF